MSSHMNNRRKIHLVDAHFQLTFIIRFSLIILCTTAIIGICTYYFNLQSTTVAFEDLRVIVKSTADFIFPTLWAVLIIVTAAGAVIVSLMTLYTSHKISGPLYRLKMEIEHMHNKDFRHPIHIRMDDQLQNIATDLDCLRVSVAKDMKAIREHVNSLSASNNNAEAIEGINTITQAYQL
jgi:methyl-accepting chemotaxis protein